MTTGTAPAPLLSVVTPSLNSARYLRETLDSLARQTFRDFEHIVVDGGSTDGTQTILAECPSIRWISEPDGELGIAAAINKGAAMARGKYIIQCCLSDGFLDTRWFERAVSYLETHPDCALVWSLPQQMTEEGALLAPFHSELLDRSPRNGREFLPFWLATQFVFPEGNYCTYTAIVRECFTNGGSPAHHLVQVHLGFVFNFMRRGYLSAFIPQVTSYFRKHQGRFETRRAIELPAARRYQKDVIELWSRIVLGRESYVFRDPQGRPLGGYSLKQRAWLCANAAGVCVSRLKVLRYPPIYVIGQLWRKLSGRPSSTARL